MPFTNDLYTTLDTNQEQSGLQIDATTLAKYFDDKNQINKTASTWNESNKNQLGALESKDKESLKAAIDDYLRKHLTVTKPTGENCPAVEIISQCKTYAEAIKKVKDPAYADGKNINICAALLSLHSFLDGKGKLMYPDAQKYAVLFCDKSANGTETTGTETNGTGTETNGTGTETNGTGTETNGTGTETNGTGTETNGTGTETNGTGTETNETGTETNGTGTETNGTGTETNETGTETNGTGTETNGTGTETNETGTETNGTGTETNGTGTETNGTGTETNGTGTETNGTGTETNGTGTETNGTGTEKPGTGTEKPGNDVSTIDPIPETTSDNTNTTEAMDGVPTTIVSGVTNVDNEARKNYMMPYVDEELKKVVATYFAKDELGNNKENENALTISFLNQAFSKDALMKEQGDQPEDKAGLLQDKSYEQSVAYYQALCNELINHPKMDGRKLVIPESATFDGGKVTLVYPDKVSGGLFKPNKKIEGKEKDRYMEALKKLSKNINFLIDNTKDKVYTLGLNKVDTNLPTEGEKKTTGQQNIDLTVATEYYTAIQIEHNDTNAQLSELNSKYQKSLGIIQGLTSDIAAENKKLNNVKLKPEDKIKAQAKLVSLNQKLLEEELNLLTTGSLISTLAGEGTPGIQSKDQIAKRMDEIKEAIKTNAEKMTTWIGKNEEALNKLNNPEITSQIQTIKGASTEQYVKSQEVIVDSLNNVMTQSSTLFAKINKPYQESNKLIKTYEAQKKYWQDQLKALNPADPRFDTLKNQYDTTIKSLEDNIKVEGDKQDVLLKEFTDIMDSSKYNFLKEYWKDQYNAFDANNSTLKNEYEITTRTYDKGMRETNEQITLFETQKTALKNQLEALDSSDANYSTLKTQCEKNIESLDAEIETIEKRQLQSLKGYSNHLYKKLLETQKTALKNKLEALKPSDANYSTLKTQYETSIKSLDDDIKKIKPEDIDFYDPNVRDLLAQEEILRSALKNGERLHMIQKESSEELNTLVQSGERLSKLSNKESGISTDIIEQTKNNQSIVDKKGEEVQKESTEYRTKLGTLQADIDRKEEEVKAELAKAANNQSYDLEKVTKNQLELLTHYQEKQEFLDKYNDTYYKDQQNYQRDFKNTLIATTAHREHTKQNRDRLSAQMAEVDKDIATKRKLVMDIETQITELVKTSTTDPVYQQYVDSEITRLTALMNATILELTADDTLIDPNNRNETLKKFKAYDFDFEFTPNKPKEGSLCAVSETLHQLYLDEVDQAIKREQAEKFEQSRIDYIGTNAQTAIMKEKLAFYGDYDTLLLQQIADYTKSIEKNTADINTKKDHLVSLAGDTESEKELYADIAQLEAENESLEALKADIVSRQAKLEAALIAATDQYVKMITNNNKARNVMGENEKTLLDNTTALYTDQSTTLYDAGKLDEERMKYVPYKVGQTVEAPQESLIQNEADIQWTETDKIHLKELTSYRESQGVIIPDPLPVFHSKEEAKGKFGVLIQDKVKPYSKTVGNFNAEGIALNPDYSIMSNGERIANGSGVSLEDKIPLPVEKPVEKPVESLIKNEEDLKLTETDKQYLDKVTSYRASQGVIIPDPLPVFHSKEEANGKFGILAVAGTGNTDPALIGNFVSESIIPTNNYLMIVSSDSANYIDEQGKFTPYHRSTGGQEKEIADETPEDKKEENETTVINVEQPADETPEDKKEEEKDPARAFQNQGDQALLAQQFNVALTHYQQAIVENKMLQDEIVNDLINNAAQKAEGTLEYALAKEYLTIAHTIDSTERTNTLLEYYTKLVDETKAHIDVANIETLNVNQAKTLIFQYKGKTLSLPKVTKIDEGTMKVLKKHKGDVELNGMRSLSAQQLGEFVGHEGTLSLNKMRSLSPDKAMILIKNKGPLSLNSLVIEEKATLEYLLQHKYPISLGSLELKDIPGIWGLRDELKKASNITLKTSGEE